MRHITNIIIATIASIASIASIARARHIGPLEIKWMVHILWKRSHTLMFTHCLSIALALLKL